MTKIASPETWLTVHSTWNDHVSAGRWNAASSTGEMAASKANGKNKRTAVGSRTSP